MEFRAPLPTEVPDIHTLLSENGWAHRVPDAAWLQKLVERSKCVVAVSAGEVIGFGRGVTDDLSNGYLSMLVVAKEHRGSGIGSRLVCSLVEAEPGITWVLRAERPGARQFFEKLGFSVSATAMERKREQRHET